MIADARHAIRDRDAREVIAPIERIRADARHGTSVIGGGDDDRRSASLIAFQRCLAARYREGHIVCRFRRIVDGGTALFGTRSVNIGSVCRID
jgi:hypothetical protein